MKYLTVDLFEKPKGKIPQGDIDLYGEYFRTHIPPKMYETNDWDLHFFNFKLEEYSSIPQNQNSSVKMN